MHNPDFKQYKLPTPPPPLTITFRRTSKHTHTQWPFGVRWPEIFKWVILHIHVYDFLMTSLAPRSVRPKSSPLLKLTVNNELHSERPSPTRFRPAGQVHLFCPRQRRVLKDGDVFFFQRKTHFIHWRTTCRVYLAFWF